MGRAMALWSLAVLAAAGLMAGCPATKPKACKKADYVQVMKETAIKYYQQGDYIRALESIKEAESCRPKDPEVYYWMGLIYYQRGKAYDAIASLQKSLEIDPGYTESHLALGVIYLDLGRYDEAIAEFDAATRDDLFRRPWEAYNNLGYAYLKKGDYAKAEFNLRQAVKLNPNFCVSYCNLGELYSLQGDRRQAVDNYRKAIKLCPDNYARPRFLLAVEYGYANNYRDACNELQLASRTPSAPEAEQIEKYQRLYNCPTIITAP
jgi:type IV pilus biogenesis/stability protein PilW